MWSSRMHRLQKAYDTVLYGGAVLNEFWKSPESQPTVVSANMHAYALYCGVCVGDENTSPACIL